MREALTATALLAATAFAAAGTYAQFAIDLPPERRVVRLLWVPGNVFAFAALAVAFGSAWPSNAARLITFFAIVVFASINAFAIAFLRSRRSVFEGDRMPIAIGVNAAMATAVYVILSN